MPLPCYAITKSRNTRPGAIAVLLAGLLTACSDEFPPESTAPATPAPDRSVSIQVEKKPPIQQPQSTTVQSDQSPATNEAEAPDFESLNLQIDKTITRSPDEAEHQGTMHESDPRFHPSPAKPEQPRVKLRGDVYTNKDEKDVLKSVEGGEINVELKFDE